MVPPHLSLKSSPSTESLPQPPCPFTPHSSQVPAPPPLLPCVCPQGGSNTPHPLLSWSFSPESFSGPRPSPLVMMSMTFTVVRTRVISLTGHLLRASTLPAFSYLILTITRRGRRYYYHPHFTGAETEVQRGHVSCPNTQLWEMVELGFPRAAASGPHRCTRYAGSPNARLPT